MTNDPTLRQWPPRRVCRALQVVLAVAATFLKAYRWQYIVSGVMQPRFQKVLFGTLNPAQMARVNTALASLLSAAPAEPSRLVEPA